MQRCALCGVDSLSWSCPVRPSLLLSFPIHMQSDRLINRVVVDMQLPACCYSAGPWPSAAAAVTGDQVAMLLWSHARQHTTTTPATECFISPEWTVSGHNSMRPDVKDIKRVLIDRSPENRTLSGLPCRLHIVKLSRLSSGVQVQPMLQKLN